MPTLYELSHDFKYLLDLLEDPNKTELDASIGEAFHHSTLALSQKAENVVMMIRELEARAEARRAEAEFHAGRAGVAQNAANRLRNYLHDTMQRFESTSLDAGRFTVKRVRNGGRPPVDFDAALMPERFRQVKELVSWDFDAARKEALENPDVEWAHIGDRGEHIRIK